MAQYMGTVQGNKGDASRLGSKKSGLMVSANGWTVGAEVVIVHEDGKDIVRVFKTGGSNGGTRRQIAEFNNVDPGITLSSTEWK